MADVTVKHIDDLESHGGNGRSFRAQGARRDLVRDERRALPAGYADYPDHDHEKDGQEEVYFVVEGSATLRRATSRSSSRRDVRARRPGQKRKLVPGDDGVTLLALGGKPGSFEANV